MVVVVTAAAPLAAHLCILYCTSSADPCATLFKQFMPTQLFNFLAPPGQSCRRHLSSCPKFLPLPLPAPDFAPPRPAGSLLSSPARQQRTIGWKILCDAACNFKESY